MANNASTDSIALHIKHDDDRVPSELAASDVDLPNSIPETAINGKTREQGDVSVIKGPLTLLELPVDVLRLIVTYTNDLIALALTHSALYDLAVPNIYSRFDIVWPDSSASAQSSKSVDALSYGLATLCFPSRFAETTGRLRGNNAAPSRVSHRLTNNNYAKYIRKFSIGDGPSDWTSEYLITKESGKMLGTLVAIAVSKMVNLETFVWDMPTGVLSDVFMALSSLEDHQGYSKLEKLWIRWHDSSATSPSSSSASSPTTTLPPINPPPPPPPPQVIPAFLPGGHNTSNGNYVAAPTDDTVSQLRNYAQSCVEYPTFSILPPLKSLTVLDIDDLSYLDEMSVLIERSASRLRELQIGISKKASTLHEFTQPWDGANLQQVDHEAKWPGESRIPTTRLGGVLGVLVGRIYDIRRKSYPKSHLKPGLGESADLPIGTKNLETVKEKLDAPQSPNATSNDPDPYLGRRRLDGKLKLEKLALERVTLSIIVCSRAIEWVNLTNLTILNCRHHEALWKALRKQFQPKPPAHGSPQGTPTRYRLTLKHLTTDLVSPELLSFMRETIAPNTMETIFLQDRGRTSKPSVTLEQIFKCVVKRQRNSLRKLLIDSSSEKRTTNPIMPPSVPGRWKHWAVKDECLSYITSGRMANLRELGMVIDFKDWHMFLQQLPQLANLRSLYIPQMLDRRSTPPAAKELALQIVDIISLRREIRLAYVGLWDKCFEITEHSSCLNNSFQDNDDHAISVTDTDHIGGNSDGDDDTEDDDNDDGNDSFMDGDSDFMEEVSEDADSESESFAGGAANRPQPRLRLREILYYDDKVELFRARHGKL
ncbi:hypothetical protein NPX13_g6202 [Xylaria arbuscula]|uniref:F-box domain-containing protein n=1 Tax=Xylaria arbuscula TaxID=114810 RepID=A0A9W8NCZ9_9PEZI|nr:hypothetical protein NPX13_g6202 [Xylaria arbuscula]